MIERCGGGSAFGRRASCDGIRFTVYDKATTPALRVDRIVALATGTTGGGDWP
jgi:hypothetical protein